MRNRYVRQPAVRFSVRDRATFRSLTLIARALYWKRVFHPARFTTSDVTRRHHPLATIPPGEIEITMRSILAWIRITGCYYACLGFDYVLLLPFASHQPCNDSAANGNGH